MKHNAPYHELNHGHGVHGGHGVGVGVVFVFVFVHGIVVIFANVLISHVVVTRPTVGDVASVSIFVISPIVHGTFVKHVVVVTLLVAVILPILPIVPTAHVVVTKPLLVLDDHGVLSVLYVHGTRDVLYTLGVRDARGAIFVIVLSER